MPYSLPLCWKGHNQTHTLYTSFWGFLILVISFNGKILEKGHFFYPRKFVIK